MAGPLGPGSEVDGRFRIIEKRGSGSMGVVFRAEDIWLGRAVAIKMIDAAYAGDEATSKYFQQEARALAQIRHENVVHVYSFGQNENGAFYFAMEYVDGEPLDTMIESHAARGETIELERAASILRAISRGLMAVHDRKLVHRDVKPGNIVIEKETNRPVLVDFGLARRAKTSNPRMTTTAGTPSYMAPEQARDVDGTRTTSASDLYAFACTAFELFTGRAVFDGADVYEILLKHLNDEPPALSSFRPDLSTLDPVFARALSKDPDQRQPSCAAFQAEMDAALKNAGASVPSGRASTPSIRPGTGTGMAQRRIPGANAIRVFLLESDEALARQITRAADRALDVPAIECFTGAADLVSAFERAPADIVVLDEESSTSPLATVVNAIRRLEGSNLETQIVVLSRSWEAGPSGLASLRVKELPKPINAQVLGSVLRSAGVRRRPSNPGESGG